MEKKMRACGFYWSTNDNLPGSNHGCNKEQGHDDGMHVCHCNVATPAPMTRGQAIELAEVIQVSLSEFTAGLKALPNTMSVDDRETIKIELSAAASVLRENVYDFLTSLIAHGVG